MVDTQASQSSDSGSAWSILRNSLRINQTIFFSQVLLIYIVVIACVLNLSLSSENHCLWSSLLSGSLGYLLPAPKLQKQNGAILSNTSVQ